MENDGQTAFQQAMAGYRRQLLDQSAAMQTEFDKNLVTLSGGAIGVSFIFLQNAKAAFGVERLVNLSILSWAWIAWACSIACVLISYYTSSIALARTAEKVDDRTIFLDWSKSIWNRLTRILNPLGAVLFFTGLVLLIVFVTLNTPTK